jgi:hypothetical protein
MEQLVMAKQASACTQIICPAHRVSIPSQQNIDNHIVKSVPVYKTQCDSVDQNTFPESVDYTVMKGMFIWLTLPEECRQPGV